MILKGTLMSSPLAKYRHSAYVAQAGCCFYCGLPMWEDKPESFARALGLTQGQARMLRSTAEHLHARCDGGRDARENIVAACAHCNHKRHLGRKVARDWPAHKAWVQRRLSAGAWFDRAMLQQLWRVAEG